MAQGGETSVREEAFPVSEEVLEDVDALQGHPFPEKHFIQTLAVNPYPMREYGRNGPIPLLLFGSPFLKESSL